MIKWNTSKSAKPTYSSFQYSMSINNDIGTYITYIHNPRWEHCFNYEELGVVFFEEIDVVANWNCINTITYVVAADKICKKK